MATIIKIGSEYVNLDIVTSIKIIRDGEVCLHVNGNPYYITCHRCNEVREILDVLADRTKRECEEKPKDICTGHLCGICDKFSILRADGESYHYGCTVYNKTIPAIGAVRDISPKDFKD